MTRGFPLWASAGALVALATHSIAEAEPASSAEIFHRHVRFLASDALDGRFPGTPGGERAAAYLANEFSRIGLAPGGDEGGYRQALPLFGTRARTVSLSYVSAIGGGRRTIADTSRCLWTAPAEESAEIEGELVFAGYALSDPARGWDHLGAERLDGAVLLVLEGLSEKAAAELPGEPRGHYERQDTKLRLAAAHGASAVVFLEAPGRERAFSNCGERAGFEQLHAGWDARMPPAAVWLSDPAAGRLLQTAGVSFAELAARAETRRLDPDPLGVRIRLEVEQVVRSFTAPNVVAWLPAASPDAATVLVTAHYDAFGVGPPDESGDRIYNGARDNAAGTAGLLVLAESLARREVPLDRHVVFLATTAEEATYDHVGARYYAENPLRPLDRTVIALNLDGINVIAPTTDFLVFPAGVTDAESTLAALARPLGMEPGSTSWQDGMRFSFDTAEFLERGLPALTLWHGSRYRGLDREEIRRRSGFAKIHRPSDEIEPFWDDAAIEQHLELYLAAIRHYARERTEAPSLLPENPFTPRIEARRTARP